MSGGARAFTPEITLLKISPAGWKGIQIPYCPKKRRNRL
jgi:hypothetical protein